MEKLYFEEFDWKEKDWGGVPEQKIIFEDTLEHIPNIKNNLSKLIEEGKVIIGTARVIFRQTGALASYQTQRAYQFTDSAKEEWEEILQNRFDVFDYSEV